VHVIEDRHVYRPTGQRGPSADTNKLQGRFSWHDGDVMAGALEPTKKFAGFVRSNAARYPEDDATHHTLLSVTQAAG
jgi:hypothetical protein